MQLYQKAKWHFCSEKNIIENKMSFWWSSINVISYYYGLGSDYEEDEDGIKHANLVS